MIDTINAYMPPLSKIPQPYNQKSDGEVEKAAHDFTSVFFNECVSKMLEEVKNEEEDFANDIYRSMFAQAIGEELTESQAGRSISNVILGDIIKMQEKLQGASNHDR